MSWNYRVLKKTDENSSHEFDPFYSIHEVYYDDDGKPEFCSTNPVGITGDSLEELKEVLKYFSAAMSKPVLNYDDFIKHDQDAADSSKAEKTHAAVAVIALDLEGTLIQDMLDPKPRPGLYDFLVFCKNHFRRIVMMTTVPEEKFRKLATALIQQGDAPEWFSEVQYINWERPHKDLRRIDDASPKQIIIVDDYEGYIHPNQKAQWVPIKSFFDRENDTELSRVKGLLATKTN